MISVGQALLDSDLPVSEKLKISGHYTEAFAALSRNDFEGVYMAVGAARAIISKAKGFSQAGGFMNSGDDNEG